MMPRRIETGRTIKGDNKRPFCLRFSLSANMEKTLVLKTPLDWTIMRF